MFPALSAAAVGWADAAVFSLRPQAARDSASASASTSAGMFRFMQIAPFRIFAREYYTPPARVCKPQGRAARGAQKDARQIL